MKVEIWTDINCPFCYLGKQRFEEALDAFPHRDEVEVVHRSFELNPEAPKDESRPVIPMIAKKYGISEQQAAANERNIGADAAGLGLPYLTEGRDCGNSFDMHRLLHFALAHDKQDDLLTALYRGNFAERPALFGDDERLVELAVQAGLNENEVRTILADPTAYADAVRSDERQAAELGCTGVPFFVFDRKYAISGAQPPEAFAQALQQTHATATPLETLPSTAVCGPDGCEVPDRTPTT
ncbi:DsbA family oxidoreductase [Actinocorallia lasiicapitis]